MWFIAQDVAGNSQSTPALVDLTTTADETPPTDLTGFPVAANVGDFSFDILVKLAEAGSVFAIVLPDGADAPSALQVVLGTATGAIASGVVTVVADTVGTITFDSGLSAMQAYDVFVVAQDAQPIPNLQSAVTKVDVITVGDATPPSFVASTPQYLNVQDFSFQVRASLDEPGTVRYVVLPKSSVAPLLVDIIAGTDGSGSPGVAAGSFAVPSAATPVTHTVDNGVLAATEYDVYLFAEVCESLTSLRTLRRLLTLSLLCHYRTTRLFRTCSCHRHYCSCARWLTSRHLCGAPVARPSQVSRTSLACCRWSSTSPAWFTSSTSRHLPRHPATANCVQALTATARPLWPRALSLYCLRVFPQRTSRLGLSLSRIKSSPRRQSTQCKLAAWCHTSC